MDKRMTIGELARLAGVTTKTIRFYSNEGLLPSSKRSEAGYRLYTDEDLERLALAEPTVVVPEDHHNIHDSTYRR